MAFIIVPALISLAASLAASALSSKSGKQNATQDWTPTSIATRGAWIPNVFGTCRVSPVFGWAGKRSIESRKVGETGGMSSKDINQDFYLERGWHQICKGPVYALHAILEDGKVIWKGPIYQADSPNGGVLISTSSKGKGYFYWGTDNQDINTALSTDLGVASRWKKLCYMYWNKKELGTSPRWGQVDYVISVKHNTRAISSSLHWLDAETEGGYNSGCNPGHILYELLTAPYPCGAAIDPKYVDKGAIEALAAALEEEHLPANFQAKDGYEIEKIIGDLMNDFGFLLPQVYDRLFPKIVRGSSDPIPVLSNDVIQPEPPERIFKIESDPIDRLSFVFSDRQNNYEQTDIPGDEDANAGVTFSRNTKTIQLNCVNDRLTAQRVANRKSPEMFTTSESYTINVNRNATQLHAGQRLLINDIGNLIVVSRKPNDKESTVQLKVMYDQFSFLPSNWVPSDVGGDNSPTPVDPLPDLYQAVRMIPSALSGTDETSLCFTVLRIAAHNQTFGAKVHVSIDGGTTYSWVDSQNISCAGGPLLGTLASGSTGTTPNTSEPYIDVGPAFDSSDEDALTYVQDLSGNDVSWENGIQLAFLNHEILSVQHIEPYGTDDWQCMNCIRGKFGSPSSSHSSGVVFLVPDRNSLNPILLKPLFGSSAVPNGFTLKVKVQPYNDNGEVDLADCPVLDLVIDTTPD